MKISTLFRGIKENPEFLQHNNSQCLECNPNLFNIKRNRSIWPLLWKKDTNIDQPEKDLGMRLTNVDCKAVSMPLLTFKTVIISIAAIDKKIGHLSKIYIYKQCKKKRKF